MARTFSVKLLLAFALSVAVAARAEDVPDAQALLAAARAAQSAQNWNLIGHLKMGRSEYPLKLTINKNTTRYEFTDNGDVLTLRLGEKSSTLEETKAGKTARITAGAFAEKLRDTDISYEDLAMRFLYWPEATVIGSDLITAQSCWKIEVLPPAKAESQYARAVLWLSKDGSALMKAETYGADGKWIRRFNVKDGMKRDGVWLPKEMRIESAASKSQKYTYLIIDDVVK